MKSLLSKSTQNQNQLANKLKNSKNLKETLLTQLENSEKIPNNKVPIIISLFYVYKILGKFYR